MWLAYRLFFVIFTTWDCEAFPSPDDLSKSVSRKPSDRSVLITLAKTLSTSLQKAMTANNLKIENILGDQQQVMAAVEKIEADFNEMKNGGKGSDEKYAKLETDVKALQDRRNLDEMLWKFNTQVCNASIEVVKQDIDTKIAELKSEQIVQTNEDKRTVSDELFIGESFNTDDIFKDFEDALAEYEEQEDYFKESQSEKLTVTKVTDPVGNLVAETNKFLMELESKYTGLSDQMKTLQTLASEPRQTFDPELEDKLKTRMVKIEAKFDFLLKNLQSIMEGADDDIRNDINMRMEDFNVLRKTTSSRLSVYEARIDMLEQLVLEYSQKTTEPPNLFFPATTEAIRTTPRYLTTEAPDPAYDELGGNDFSMLGITNPKDLDILVASGQNCLNPPCDKDLLPSYEESRSGFGLLKDMPLSIDLRKGNGLLSKRNVIGNSDSRPNPTLQPRVPLKNPTAKNNVPDTCDCEKLRVKTIELDHEMKFLSAEVGSALAGMRSSLTALLHRIESVEKQSKTMQQVSCVATKEALKMPGMDAWCSENCRKGNCPSHLCSCPNIN